MMHAVIHAISLFLAKLGYVGVMLGLMIEVIPSEVVLSYAGFLVSQGQMAFWGAVLAGTIGGTIAQLFLYWLGYYAGRPFLLKYGKYLLIRPKHLEMAERWFHKYGPGVIFSARFVPVVRHAISIPAGIAKMSATKFTIYTVVAIVPWSMLFVYLGNVLGSRWEQANQVSGPYVKYIMIGALVILAVYIIRKITKKNVSKA
ncbi:DedA family protein [Bacillus sp. AFS018417]|uniref:DedA family protein n=1 Tax=Bacillus sp. AFS018417 TaxID=2033491 RepID=UPI001596F543|nr:DedA family protein [Bacillus sp. AFS018417]